MHARVIRVWHVWALLLLALAPFSWFAPLPRAAHLVLLAGAAGHMALTLGLGLLPAYVRRDWPAPVFAWAAGALVISALAFVWDVRVLSALVGASLLVGALQPLALLASPRWASKGGEEGAGGHAITDRVALAGHAVALLGVGLGGLALIVLPRGLPNVALVVLLLGSLLPAAFATLLFTLPRRGLAPQPLAILGGAALAFCALGAGGLAFYFARPVGHDIRPAVAVVTLAIVLAGVTIWRAPRPPAARALLAGSAVLAFLAVAALWLATLAGAPNALLPAALYAFAALAFTLGACALVTGAPLLLPGRLRRERWTKIAPTLAIAALFLLTPALQGVRGTGPAAVAFAVSALALVAGLSALARSRP